MLERVELRVQTFEGEGIGLATIVHMTSVHAASDVRVFHKECRSLARAGHNVTLIAPGAADTVIDAVRIRGIPKASGRLGRVVITLFHLYRAARREKADIYHYHDPEVTLVALLLRVTGKATIYDAHEDLPRQIVGKHWIHPALRRIVSWVGAAIEWLAAQICDGIIVAAPVIGERFPARKVCLVRNFARPEEFPLENLSPYTARPPALVYVGAITASRGIKEIVEAMSHLPEALEARLVLAGTFASKQLEAEVSALPGWDKVDYRGWQDRDQIRSLLSNARIGLNLLHPTSHYIDQPYGVKVFEYMAAGIPTIVSNFPVWKEYARENDVGITADPLDPKDIAAKAEYLLNHVEEAEELGRRARKAFESRFSWNSEAKSLLALYQRIVQVRGIADSGDMRT